ncbi:hypothetical protein SLS60_004802 [Paraconiothyrium brasiliense]|uniref:Nudix hydrolase domain-containing protein n=1 Tax=Paraconiothyrium brasiliense TaxID=300254 RepID=A0ABR3RLE2_9PLEO
MDEDQCISDNRPQPQTVFDGAQRKYFELTSFNQQPVASHVHDGNEVACRVYLPQDPRGTKEIIESMPAYKNWLTGLLQNLALQQNPHHVFHKNQYKLRSVDLQAPTWFPAGKPPGKLGFLKAQCAIEADHLEDGKKLWLPGAVFLRGGSVGVLIIIQPYDGEEKERQKLDEEQEPELLSVLAIQPRIAAGSLAFAELPAGMLDDSGDLGGKAGEEIKEEVGITVNKSDLFNMSEAAVRDIHQQPSTNYNDEDTFRETVQDSMYPSPGGCDEFLPLMLLQKRLSRQEIENLQSRNTGLREEGEVITLKVVPFKNLWREGGRDAKCLAALGLYENLKREGGILPDMPARPDEQRKRKRP